MRISLPRLSVVGLASFLVSACFVGCGGDTSGSGGSGTTSSGGDGGSGASSGGGGATSSGGTGTTGGSSGATGGGGTTGGNGGTGGTGICTPGETQPCYDGPAGTQGVGICAPGTQTCLADGSGFGPCAGQVLPATESCGDGDDNDCDGAADEGCCIPGAVEACYEGPAGSEGVGICVAGSHTCLADGSGFGACNGQVLPASETCASTADEDCDGIDCAAWIRSNSGYWSAEAIDRDGAGNVYVAATLSTQVTFGGQTFTAAGGAEGLLVEMSPDGQLVRGLTFGGAKGDYVTCLDVATDGSAVVGGYFDGMANFGGVVLNGQLKGFLMVLDPSGATRWAILLPSEVSMGAVAFAPNGDVMLFGATIGTIDLGGGALVPNEVDMLVARFAKANGAHVQSKIHGGAGNQIAYGMAPTPGGGYALTGVNTGTLQAGPSTLSKGTGLYGAFVVHMNDAGDLTAGTSITESGNGAVVLVKDVQVDPDGNIYVAGIHDQGIDIDGPGPQPLHQPPENANHVFTAKYDASYQLVGHRFLGWANQFRPSIALSGDKLFLSSAYHQGVDFGAGVVPISDDTVLAAYNLDGSLAWTRVFPSTGGTSELIVGPGPAPGTAYGAVDVGVGTIDLGGGPIQGTAAAITRFGP